MINNSAGNIYLEFIKNILKKTATRKHPHMVESGYFRKMKKKS